MNANQYAAVDDHIGRKLRQIRSARGVSLEQLGNAVVLDQSVIHRYEVGEIRVPASVLLVIAEALQVPIGTFFGETDEVVIPAIRHARQIAELPDDDVKRAILELVSYLHGGRK